MEAEGRNVALVSDAGLPGVNDPGARLVEAALAAGIDVIVLPGPSAVETALVASGLRAAQYRFLGYLPRRDTELDALWEEARSWPYAAVAFESPKRLPRSLLRLAGIAPERRVAVCRELTKLHEEVLRGTAAELAARLGAVAVRGEVTLVLAPGEAARRRPTRAGRPEMRCRVTLLPLLALLPLAMACGGPWSATRRVNSALDFLYTDPLNPIPSDRCALAPLPMLGLICDVTLQQRTYRRPITARHLRCIARLSIASPCERRINSIHLGQHLYKREQLYGVGSDNPGT